jgi:hypothetical protein
VDEQVVNLRDAGVAGVLGLMGIDEPEIVEHVDGGVFGERAVEIERHLSLGLSAGAEAGVGGEGING